MSAFFTYFVNCNKKWKKMLNNLSIHISIIVFLKMLNVYNYRIVFYIQQVNLF